MTIAEQLTSITNKIKSVKDSISNAYFAARAKGAEMPEVQNAFNLAETIRTIQVNKEVVVANVEDENLIIDNNDIFFIDHFGIAGAYTKEEVAKWTEIEFQPKEYEFLNFHSFTETLEDIQDGRVHTVGVIYECTKSFVGYVSMGAGETITIGGSNAGNGENNSADPNFSWTVKVDVDWGDGTTTRYEHANSNTPPDYTHTYEKSGIYPITFSSPNGWGNRKSLRPASINMKNVYALYTRTLNREECAFARFICIKHDLSTMPTNFMNSYYTEVLVIPPSITTLTSNFAIRALRMKFLVFTAKQHSGNVMTNMPALKLFALPDDFNAYGDITSNQLRKLRLPKDYKGNFYIENEKCIFKFEDTMQMPSVTTRVNLEELRVPEGCTTYSMTWDLTYSYIEDLYLPNSLTKLDYVKAGNVYLAATTPPVLTYSNPDSQVIVKKIYVPYSEDHSILEAYKAATNWSVFANKIEEIPQ